MKKIITVFALCLFCIVSASAQRGFTLTAVGSLTKDPLFGAEVGYTIERVNFYAAVHGNKINADHIDFSAYGGGIGFDYDLARFEPADDIYLSVFGGLFAGMYRLDSGDDGRTIGGLKTDVTSFAARIGAKIYLKKVFIRGGIEFKNFGFDRSAKHLVQYDLHDKYQAGFNLAVGIMF